MTTTKATIALALALAGGGSAAATGAPPPAASPAPSPAPATAPRDPDRPPPGSKADQALWKRAYDLNAQLLVVQHEAARLTQGVKGAGYEEKLAEAGRTGAMPQARSDALSARLRERWAADIEAVQGHWPVSKVRGCGYELLGFESAMAEGAASKAQQADTRKALEECVQRGESVLRVVEKANAELEAAIAEVGKALAPSAARPGGS